MTRCCVAMLTVVGLLAPLLLTLASPPPLTVALLVTEPAAFAATLTVSVIGG